MKWIILFASVLALGSNMTDEFIETLSDEVQAEGEVGEGLFGLSQEVFDFAQTEKASRS